MLLISNGVERLQEDDAADCSVLIIGEQIMFGANDFTLLIGRSHSENNALGEFEACSCRNEGHRSRMMMH